MVPIAVMLIALLCGSTTQQFTRELTMSITPTFVLQAFVALLAAVGVGLLARLTPMGSVVVGALYGVLAPAVMYANMTLLFRMTFVRGAQWLTFSAPFLPGMSVLVGGLLLGSGLMAVRRKRP